MTTRDWTEGRGALLEVTPATVEPVTVAQARTQLRIEHTEEDVYIGGLITEARQLLERLYGIAYDTTVLDLELERFPPGYRGREILLTRWPVQSVDQVSYIDTAGASQVLDSARYQVSTTRRPARLKPVYHETWPHTQDDTYNAVTVRFTAGFADPTRRPKPWERAVLLLVTHLYDHRDGYTPQSIKELPMGVSQQLLPWTVWS